MIGLGDEGKAHSSGVRLGRNFLCTQIRWDGDGIDILTRTEVVVASGWMVDHGKAMGVYVWHNILRDRGIGT